jgi:hypothetical protein
MTAEERFAIVVKILKAALHVSSLRTTSDARKLPKLCYPALLAGAVARVGFPAKSM